MSRRPAIRRGASAAIRSYQLTLSGLVGRQCRHLPSCSEYTDEAIQRHGLWAGGWIGIARICRCGPFGTSGIDLVPEALPASARWYKPWAYGRWRGVLAPPTRAAEPDASQSARSPSPHSNRLPASFAGVSRSPLDDHPDLSRRRRAPIRSRHHGPGDRRRHR